MNIFEALRKDHEVQRDLIDRLLKTEGNSPQRERIWKELQDELEAHAKAEERAFYVPLMKKDLTQEKARHSIAEHHDIDEVIETLNNTDMSSPGWKVNAQKLAQLLIHHLDEEEHEVFQMAGKALKEQQKENLADTYENTMQEERS